MKKENKKLLIIGVILVVAATLITVGLTYAFFMTDTQGNDDATETVIETANLRLLFTDTEVLVLNDALPGTSVSKTFTVENLGNVAINYNLNLTDVINTYVNNELVFSINDEDLMQIIPESTLPNISGTLLVASIEPQEVQTYTITIKFKETGSNQNSNMGASFSGRLQINEMTSVDSTYCTYDGELLPGAEYVNGQYTYRYMQEADHIYDSTSGAYTLAWKDMNAVGWGVALTDNTSTEPVTSTLCTYINNIPVTSYKNMFYHSQATNIDLSSFNTSNVINMNSMFYNSKVESLDVSNFDTSNVTNMGSMFYYIPVTELDVTGLETHNVEDMSYMFSHLKATTLDVSSFITNKVTNMKGMFRSTQALMLNLSNFNTVNVTDMSAMFSSSSVTTILGIENFDTRNVVNMSSMFYSCPAEVIDVSGFDTSNVTGMAQMFTYTNAEVIDVSGFDTSDVTSMNHMFSHTSAEVIDVSSFDTSNVTSMYCMFAYSKVTEIDLSNFNTSKVTTMQQMFIRAEAKTIDVTGFDTSNVTDMGAMFHSTKATTIKGLTSFNTVNVTDMSSMFMASEVTEIDLSSFDSSNVTDMDYMFNGVAAKVGYARTQADADRYNSSVGRTTITFTVK